MIINQLKSIRQRGSLKRISTTGM